MQHARSARAAQWLLAVAVAGALAVSAPGARAGDDEPYPGPLTTSTMSLLSFDVVLRGVGMGMAAIW